MHRRLALLAGTLLFIAAALAASWAGLGTKASTTAGVTALCACWWVLEPIPIPATSLIPFAAFPLVGVLSHREVAGAYGHTMILLLLGGFMLSAAVEKSGAHRRIALGLVALAGGTDRRLVLGFMLASAVCSMWISNTATTLMLLPVALAALSERDARLGPPLLLGIAYAASIGGMATPIGTPPNVIFMGAYQEATGSEISFLSWMTMGLPVAIVMIPIVWLWLTRNLKSSREMPIADADSLGPMTEHEYRVLLVFGLTALAWVFRSAPLGGWTNLFGIDANWFGIEPIAPALKTVGDSTIAIAAVIVLFLVPAGDDEGGQLLDWKTASQIPWGLLILFGGGLAIATAFGASGLSEAIGDALKNLANWPVVLAIAVLAISVTFLTEVTSNTATTTLLMPILAAAAVGAAIDPRLLMVPAALSASCAFMLPVATAPNAIMFGTGKISTRQMAREGIVLNLIGVIVITTACSFVLGSA